MSQVRPTGDPEPRARDAQESAELDTEGSSMLVYELGLATETERRRQAERATRNPSRPGRPAHRGLVDRLRRR